jgi:hypothetical protein
MSLPLKGLIIQFISSIKLLPERIVIKKIFFLQEIINRIKQGVS